MADEKKEEMLNKEVKAVEVSKAKRLLAYYEKNSPGTFVPEEVSDELHTTVLRSNLIVENQQLPIAIFVDDSIYVMVRVQVATGVIRKGNQAQIIEHLNELNRSFKVFKYFVTDDGMILLDSCIPSSDAHFEPEMVDVVIRVILEHLTDKYADLMKKVWA